MSEPIKGRTCRRCGGNLYTCENRAEVVREEAYSIVYLVRHWWCVNCSKPNRLYGHAQRFRYEQTVEATQQKSPEGTITYEYEQRKLSDREPLPDIGRTYPDTGSATENARLEMLVCNERNVKAVLRLLQEEFDRRQSTATGAALYYRVLRALWTDEVEAAKQIVRRHTIQGPRTPESGA